MRNRRIRKPAAGLMHETFPDFMRALVDAQLVEKETSTDVNWKKIYRVTKSGEIAFPFFSDPATNTLVGSMPEKIRTNSG
ncbi:MAG: hypothetical protein WCB46_08585 [Methanoregula sp.]